MEPGLMLAVATRDGKPLYTHVRRCSESHTQEAQLERNGIATHSGVDESVTLVRLLQLCDKSP